jgi:hypothetical protein
LLGLILIEDAFLGFILPLPNFIDRLHEFHLRFALRAWFIFNEDEWFSSLFFNFIFRSFPIHKVSNKKEYLLSKVSK